MATDQASWAPLPHRRLLALLACGAVIENISLKSTELEHALSADLQPDAARPELIAILRWAARPVTGAPEPLAGAIGARHTNRRFYRRGAADAATLRSLQSAAAAVAGCELRWLDDPTRRSQALKAIRIAETERFRRPALHAELFGAVRFDAGWRQSTDEWLAPAALEVEAPARPLFTLLRDWRFMRVARLFGAHIAFGLRAGYLPCALAPHLGLVLADEHDEGVANLNAGRAFQRLWLAAATEGLALQPMAAATALARQATGNGWVSAATQDELRCLLGQLREGSRGQPYILFRLGHARAPSVVSERKPLHYYVS